MNIKSIILILNIFILSSCGFKPMLVKDPQGNTIISEVQLVHNYRVIVHISATSMNCLSCNGAENGRTHQFNR